MSGDIHSDGSVELIQRWYPGGAQGNHDQDFVDGAKYLFAVRSESIGEWTFHHVVARGNDELGFEFDSVDDSLWWKWDWDDVDWFVPCHDLDFPA